MNYLESILIREEKDGVQVTTKEYLLQIKEKERDIKKQQEYIQRLKDSLDVVGISYDKEKVQGSSDYNKFAKVFSLIDEEEQNLIMMREILVKLKVKVINQIYQLADDKYKDVLYFVYVEGKSLKRVAFIMKFSYEYMKKIHLDALQAFDEKFPPQFT